MTTAFVLGNGLSRQHLNLAHLKNCGRIYGCNALYREFTPDVLVATDRPIAETIQKSGYALKNRFYTRRPIEGLGANQVIKQYHGFSSGPNALSIAAKDGHRLIFLLGFDMGPTAENKFNNIYADTEYYKTSDANPTFTGNWVKQICQIVKDHPTVRFCRIYGETTAKIPEFDEFKNFEHQDLSAFLDRINNQKDL